MSGVFSAAATDVLALDATDVFSADTTEVFSAAKAASGGSCPAIGIGTIGIGPIGIGPIGIGRAINPTMVINYTQVEFITKGDLLPKSVVIGPTCWTQMSSPLRKMVGR